MLIDCHGCSACGPACDDCVVTVLLGPTRSTTGERGVMAAGDGLDLDGTDRRALHVLAEAGLVPRLRHVRRAG